jgi:hypothetical protein
VTLRNAAARSASTSTGTSVVHLNSAMLVVMGGRWHVFTGIGRPELLH